VRTTVILLALGFALVGLQAYVRLAPVEPGRWHQDPAVPGSGAADAAGADGYRAAMLTPLGDAAALERLTEIALGSPRTRIVAGSAGEGRITFETRSLIWGFPDYTTVAAERGDGGTRVSAWARQRFGLSDLGVNRARVQGWFAALGTAG
jgi:uncharacterized protein (DUF1499 family)